MEKTSGSVGSERGNILIIGSSTSALLGLTWGGIQYPWNSAQVLVPLIVGFVGIFAWVIYEVLVPVEPTIPFRLLNNRTTLSGYIGTAIHGFVIAAALCKCRRVRHTDWALTLAGQSTCLCTFRLARTLRPSGAASTCCRTVFRSRRSRS